MKTITPVVLLFQIKLIKQLDFCFTQWASHLFMTKAGPSDLIGLNEAPVDGNYILFRHKNTKIWILKNNLNVFFQQIQLHIEIFRLSLLPPPFDNQNFKKMSIKRLDSGLPHKKSNKHGGL